MVVFKCKMCGGDLEIVEGSAVATCQYCETTQTVPAADDEKKMTLFARANRLRIACEYDKAAGIYESIVADFPDEAEAYWGLLLCRYGVEYVDDPASGKKIATCHRSSFQSIMDDSDFEMVMENSDSESRKIYREEAKYIEELRKNILAVSNEEEPYDIFICYKERDAMGSRTTDSVLAQDIYDALTDKGYRVFFARVSLEDKLGQEYEPYIFAALNSARIMLVVGTDYEYFNAVWVKNEWSRYLKLMEQDKSRYLIPCYKDVDAYDMPKEFNKLQAQDMGKIGAIQDLTRGIKKLLGKDEVHTEEQVNVVSGGISVANLLKRGELALEDENWSAADEFYEQILNTDAENGEAYLGKFMVSGKIPSRAAIERNPALLFDTDNIRKRELSRIRKYASTGLLLWIDGIETAWKAELEKKEAALNARRKEQEEQKKIKLQKRQTFQKLQDRLAAGYAWGHSICVKNDGTVAVAYKIKHKLYLATLWKDIVAADVEAFSCIGLKSDGKVVAIPSDKASHVKDWTDIVAINIGTNPIVGLKSDGTVVISANSYDLPMYEQKWQDIVAIAAGESHVAGLKSDGTVVAVGKNKHGQLEVSSWTDIVAISAQDDRTIGLQSNGRVVAVGEGIWDECKVTDWTDIVAISAGKNSTVGLKSDGTVMYTGDKSSSMKEVENWQNIIAINAGCNCIIGLQDDGTVKVAGRIKHGRELIEGLNLFDKYPSEEALRIGNSYAEMRSSFLK